MTEEQKKECRENGYTVDHMGDFIDCNKECETCKLSYGYVLGYNDGYKQGYNDGY